MAASRPPTKPGIRKLSDVARHLAVPTGIASTGWPAVRKTCVEKLGIEFDDWQESAGRVILAKRADGNLAAMIDGVGLSLPRQVGKTYLVGAMVFALCVNMPGLLVIWSAHHARTHGETFLAMQGFAERLRVKPHVRQIFTGSGDEEIRFHNGSRILFGARERGFGRGIPGVDVLIFDEAQILSDKALSNMLATMNTSRFGLQLYIGTPPKPDDMSESFTRMRTEAMEKRLTDGAWIELGADPAASPDDRAQWRKANPSYPARTPEQSILRLKRKLAPEDFLREGLGIWGAVADSAQAIDEAGWKDTTVKVDAAGKIVDPDGAVEEWAAFGVAVAFDRSYSAIGAAGIRSDTLSHLELVQHARGVGWVVDRCIKLDADNLGATFVIDGGGPAASLIEPLRNAGLTVVVLTLKDVARACAWLVDAVTGRLLRHGPDPILAATVAVTKWRNAGDQRVFGRRVSSDDISSIESVTIAAHVLPTVTPLDDVTAAFI